MAKPTEEIVLNDEKELDARRIAYHVREIIKLIGEDPNREGLRKTPERYEKALKFLTSGYHAKRGKHSQWRDVSAFLMTKWWSSRTLNSSAFASTICCRFSASATWRIFRISASSASAKLRGSSTCSRAACRSRSGLPARSLRPFRTKLALKGVGVIIEARHLCMQMRGVEKQHGQAVTSAMLGGFRHNKQTRDEFLSLVRTQKLLTRRGQTFLSVSLLVWAFKSKKSGTGKSAYPLFLVDCHGCFRLLPRHVHRATVTALIERNLKVFDMYWQASTTFISVARKI